MQQKKDPRFGRTIRDDLRQLKFKEDIGSEYKDLKEYYLSEERKKKLAGMGRCRRFFLIPWWLLKALFFKLTPFRRLLLLISIFLVLISGNNRIDSENVSIDILGPGIIGGFILLFILALELKDKLLAKTELEEGRAIQLALMPDSQPVVDGWDIWLYTQSANDVGGDLIDFIPLSENRFAVSVGDVAGKGLSAALLMAKLQATIRALIPDYSSLTSLGEKINEIFVRDSLSKIFASLVVIEFAEHSGTIKILNSGHIPPLIIKPGIVEQLKKDSPALGLIKNAKFEEHSISLNSNEIIIVYSDGLSEAQNETGKFYGDERLITLLNEINKSNSENIGNAVLREIKNFIGKAPVHDDLTLAVLKRK